MNLILSTYISTYEAIDRSADSATNLIIRWSIDSFIYEYIHALISLSRHWQSDLVIDEATNSFVPLMKIWYLHDKPIDSFVSLLIHRQMYHVMSEHVN